MRRVMVAAHLAVAAGVLTAAFALAAPAVAGTTFYVDNTVSCSDSGPATQAAPLCTIGAGAARTTAGSTVKVLHGSYNETISPPTSGISGAPVVFDAAPTGVTLTSAGRGFSISSRSWITVSGFAVSGTGDAGIYASSSSNLVITNNTVTGAGHPVSGSTKYGINFSSTTNSTVSNNTTANNSDAGVYMNGTSTGNTIVQNISYGNARVYTRAAPGIDIRGPGNTVTRNISHDNEDSGIQIYQNGSNDSTVISSNLVYANGDHGIDNLDSSGTVIVANTVVGNTTSGINVEGSSSGARIANNISIDNALTNTFGQKGQIRVDANSVSGSTMDRDLVYMSASGGHAFKWNDVYYDTVGALQSASGQEPAGLQADPAFVSRAGNDYHLRPGSPAIDSADASAPQQPALDLALSPRFDDPATPNTGAGSPTFVDRGAYEFQGLTLDHITIAPVSSSIPAGSTQTYTVEGFDAQGHSLGDLTGSSTFSVTPAAISCVANACGGSTPGSYTVRATNGAATADASLAVLGPVISSFTPSAGNVGSTVSILGSGFTGATVVRFGGASAPTFTVVSDGKISATVPAGALTGPISVTVGSASGTSASKFSVLPTITSLSPTTGVVGSVTTMTGTGLADTSAVSIHGVSAAFTITSSSTVDVTIPDAAITGRIKLTNAGGSVTSTQRFNVQPTVDSFSPGSGPVGSTVTITGTGFAGTTTVKFGKVLATSFSVLSSTSIQAEVPVGFSAAKIRVKTVGASGLSATAFKVTPVISSFTPSGAAAGTSVSITGSGFSSKAKVRFNGKLAAVTFVSSTKVRAVVPVGASTGTITVQTSGGKATSADPFIVTP